MRGELIKNKRLSDYTSWRVGGPAENLYLPADYQDLIDFLPKISAETVITWLGLGSNTLVREGGLSGVTIVTQGRLNKLQVLEDGKTLRVEAGVACPLFARFCARLGWHGTEFMAGIPGTVGGALAMNAGCHGGETWDTVVAVETVDRNGQVRVRKANEYQVGYRHVKGFPDEWFLAGHFVLNAGDKEKALETIRELLSYRTKTQPTSEPSGGSVFRNPPGDYAARLIETCGLKGKCLGGAMVSAKHANFIVNDGTATASDIEQLIAYVAKEVKRVHNIDLIREVHVLGDLRPLEGELW